MTANPAGTRFDPLDMWCPDCFVAPGIRCVWTAADGTSHSRRCHAARVTSARKATDRSQRRARPRRPGWSVWPPPPGSTS